MKYTSTRSHETVSETFALLHGLASDGGLYVPETFPEKCLSYQDVADKSYEEIALVVLSKLFTTFTEAELETMIRSAYNTVNFSFNKKLNEAFSLYGGVDNIFNKKI